MITDYEKWWDNEGSSYKQQDDCEDLHEFVHRVTAVAWLNGGFVMQRIMMTRTCSECEFYINKEYDIGCSKLGISDNKPDFGCNYFSRLQDNG
jgi:hypothetical protein